MIKIEIKRCRACGKYELHGNKLYRLDDLWYCRDHWREQLQWHESRTVVTRALEGEARESAKINKSFRARMLHGKTPKWPGPKKTDWRGYIAELCELAGWALEVGDRKTFIHYASRAVLAWGLQEVSER